MFALGMNYIPHYLTQFNAYLIFRCHDSVESAMKSIVPQTDSEIVVERFKSGDVPPADFKFEDMQNPQVKKYTTLQCI